MFFAMSFNWKELLRIFTVINLHALAFASFPSEPSPSRASGTRANPMPSQAAAQIAAQRAAELEQATRNAANQALRASTRAKATQKRAQQAMEEAVQLREILTQRERRRPPNVAPVLVKWEYEVVEEAERIAIETAKEAREAYMDEVSTGQGYTEKVEEQDIANRMKQETAAVAATEREKARAEEAYLEGELGPPQGDWAGI
eukprot:gnl/MRDRNA2_/MRDRNA2_102023_c0_seq1.p1 gnl/MRDRNA2_/MRDRNA2_102023_c0~~gnl/MRDRNA2_/MRDRNA2_102023_c0_seq1.p1  ORF type:complete len:202 (+),score=53.96 gnl/MRDRNA2_/MRDRNA2_102023_c0_seq1:73-678(+)